MPRSTGSSRRSTRAKPTLDDILDQDGPCEDAGCPVVWEAICRWCGQKFCLQHVHTHGCAEGWLAKRLMADPDLVPTVWVEVEEDD